MPRRPTRKLVLCLLVALTVLGIQAPATADPLPGTVLTLTAPATGKAGVSVSFTATLTTAAGDPVPRVTVFLQRLGTAWVGAGTGVTDASGKVVIDAAPPAGPTSYRVVFPGDGAHAAAVSQAASVTGLRHPSTVVLSGPSRVVDESSARLSVRWRAADGSAVSGLVDIYRKLGSGSFSFYQRLRTSADGSALLDVRPRVDSVWRARGHAGSWWLSASSTDLSIDNRPQIAPLAYPAAAPRPAYLRAQARATGTGANTFVTGISNAVWRSMVGRSWHRGCPVGRSGLRLLRVNYWGLDGYRYRGEMVLNAAVVHRAAAALRDMYAGHYPIRRMYRVDRFGWSKRLRGANDYASMRADNTSAFNCRDVVNRPGVRSPHARGRSVDINPWENPYRSATGWVPNSWWSSRSHARIAWRSSSHPVVRIWRSHGFRWTYGTGDSQHVDGRATPVTLGGFSG